MATLKPIVCPTCGASRFEHDSEGNLICSHCGVKFASPREEILCPACGTANQPDARRCMNCGLTLGKVCAVCNTLNPPGTEHCLQCASPLDALSAVTSRMGEGKRLSDALREKQLVDSKGEDMLYMERQRERLDQMERERLQALAAQRAEARRQQQTLVIVSIIGVTVLIALVVAVVLLVR